MIKLSPRTRTLLLHDAGVFAAAFVATGVLTSDNITTSVIVAALVAAAKVTLRQLFPVPPKI